jgi:hypothetical protein
VIPGPRVPKGHQRPVAGRDRNRALRPARPPSRDEYGPVGGSAETSQPVEPPLVSLTRCPRGWAVISPAGADSVADLIEGLSLADLVTEEFGVLPEPDRTARRSARGPADAAGNDTPPLVDARIAALERTVAQLEHALAARVATERAIGVLAERHSTSARAAFEELRRDARSQGRPVAELAREVLESLATEAPAVAHRPAGPTAPLPPRPPAVAAPSAAVMGRLSGPRAAGADGGS